MNWNMNKICVFITIFAFAIFFSLIPHANAEGQIIVPSENDETTWFQYINKRLNEEIQREGLNLKVRTTYIGAAPSYSYVSLNHPYQIDCNTFGMGISINFGEEENSPSANITGDFSSDHKNEPTIGVNPNSIAAKALDTKLCSYVANWMAQITSR